MPSLEPLIRVGRNQDPIETQRNFVLLFVAGHYAWLEERLREEGFRVIVPSQADQAVALSLNHHNRIAAALIDESSAIEVEQWSLAQSLKAVCPNTSVMLILRSPESNRPQTPKGVDYVVSDQDPAQVIEILRRCMQS